MVPTTANLHQRRNDPADAHPAPHSYELRRTVADHKRISDTERMICTADLLRVADDPVDGAGPPTCVPRAVG